MSNEHRSPVGSTPEEILLMNLGHEIMNFRRGFPKTSLKHTFILSPYGSGMFGLLPQNQKIYFGIPKLFYDKFKSAKWLYAAKVENQAGLFLVMSIGIGKSQHPIGLRVFVRSKRLAALDESITKLRALPMDKSGVSRESDLLLGFNLPFHVLSDFRWEKEAEEILENNN